MRNMNKVWIVGANGQLGTAINELLDRRNFEILSTDVDEVDITKADEVVAYAELNRPEIIINCAGLTSIEACEKDPEQAYRVNAIGARNISIATRRVRAKLVHISTDDIFNGESNVPYNEFDVPQPITVYGKSKLAGEQFVKDFAQKYFIVRSTWIYGNGKNYVKELIETAKNKESIAIASDTMGCPTSAKELAKFILYIMDTCNYGIYHATCEGKCSRLEFAHEVFRLINACAQIEPVTREKDTLAAQRPAYTVLDNFMLRLVGDYEMPQWQEALKVYIESLK